jgi:hypothetical protein
LWRGGCDRGHEEKHFRGLHAGRVRVAQVERTCKTFGAIFPESLGEI